MSYPEFLRLPNEQPMWVYQGRRRGCVKEAGHFLIFSVASPGSVSLDRLTLQMEPLSQLNHSAQGLREKMADFIQQRDGPKSQLIPIAGGDYSQDAFDFTAFVRPDLFIPSLFQRRLMVQTYEGKNPFTCFLKAQFMVNGEFKDEWGSIGDYVDGQTLH